MPPIEISTLSPTQINTLVNERAQLQQSLRKIGAATAKIRTAIANSDLDEAQKSQQVSDALSTIEKLIPES